MNEYQRQESEEREFADDSSATERSPAEIEREIERTRERMSSNIDQLGERLSPDNLKQQAREAISVKAQDVVSNVGDQARETGITGHRFHHPESPAGGRGEPRRNLAFRPPQQERGVGRSHGALRLHRPRAA